MQDFDETGTIREKQTTTTQIRHGAKLADLIARAAMELGVDKSAFLRAAITREATRVLADARRHHLTAEDAALFNAALDTPPAPTPRAMAARDAYRARVTHAD